MYNKIAHVGAPWCIPVVTQQVMHLDDMFTANDDDSTFSTYIAITYRVVV